jgi:hypothetical protein
MVAETGDNSSSEEFPGTDQMPVLLSPDGRLPAAEADGTNPEFAVGISVWGKHLRVLDLMASHVRAGDIEGLRSNLPSLLGVTRAVELTLSERPDGDEELAKVRARRARENQPGVKSVWPPTRGIRIAKQ